MYSTTDGGQTWQGTTITSFTPGSTLQQMTFVDAEHGWILFSTSTQTQNTLPATLVDIFQTTDGGHTWHKIASSEKSEHPAPGSLPYNAILSGMRFLTASTGWITGKFVGTAPRLPAWFYVTHDGGHTWQQQPLPQPANVDALIISPPIFSSSHEGLLPVYLQYGAGVSFSLYVTHNSGATWTPTAQLAGVSPRVDCADINHCWLSDTTLYGTSDGGKTWAAHNGFTGLMLTSFVSSQVGWAIENPAKDRSTLLETHDGGHTWTVVFQTYMPVTQCSNPPCG